MSRLHRLDPEHGIHHVYSRGTRRWTLFIDELDYRRFMLRLGTVCMRYGVSVYAYCLMGNHFHLALYCRDGNLSNALRDLKSVYARQHNDRHGFSGPLFEARFGSRIVMSYQYLRVVLRYIHRNPLAVNSSLSLENYRWSSHAYYLDADGPRPEWLDIDFPQTLFGSASDYRSFVETNLESDAVQRVAGDVTTVPESRALPSRAAISAIALTVAASAKCEVAEIRPRMRNGLVGLVAVIASDKANYTSAELSDACGFGSPQGVRNAKIATRKRLKQDPLLQSVHDSTITKLGLF